MLIGTTAQARIACKILHKTDLNPEGVVLWHLDDLQKNPDVKRVEVSVGGKFDADFDANRPQFNNDEWTEMDGGVVFSLYYLDSINLVSILKAPVVLKDDQVDFHNDLKVMGEVNETSSLTLEALPMRTSMVCEFKKD